MHGQGMLTLTTTALGGGVLSVSFVRGSAVRIVQEVIHDNTMQRATK